MKKVVKLYKKLQNDEIQCLACNHYCKIKNGKLGLCGIRKNENGKLKLLIYGLPASIGIDPIEKKPLYHVLPGKQIFSIGTFGCNFACKFCQNREISQVYIPDKYKDYKVFPFEKIPIKYNLLKKILPYRAYPQDVINLLERNGLYMVAYTYNEPTIFVEYAYDIMKKSRGRTISRKDNLKKRKFIKILPNGKKIKLTAKFLNIFVSNGYFSIESLNLIKNYLDAINIDFKSINPNFYTKYIGADLNKVLKNIEYLYTKTDIFFEITTLLIPGLNDGYEEIKEIAKFIYNLSPNIPWHISAFYPAYKTKNIPPTPPEKLLEAYKIAKEVGLNFVYLGNTNLGIGSDTECHYCGEYLIQREGYLGENIVINKIVNGTCKLCKHYIPGIYEIEN